MLFWVHAAVAYLIFRVRFGSYQRASLDGTLVLVLIVGALLPDIIDKPVALLVSSLPSRAVAHSLFTTIGVILVVAYLARRVASPQVGPAFATGYLSHLGADLVDYFFVPQESLTFLLWPILTDYHHIDTVSDLLSLAKPTSYVIMQSVITLVAIGLWIHDGKPGYAAIRSRVHHVR